MGWREKRKEKFRLLGTKRCLKHSGTPVSSNQIKKNNSFSTIWCVVLLRWLSRDQNTELKATTCNLTVEGYVQTHTRKVRTHNSHKYIFTSLRSCKLTKLFFQSPNSLFFFPLLLSLTRLSSSEKGWSVARLPASLTSDLSLDPSLGPCPAFSNRLGPSWPISSPLSMELRQWKTPGDFYSSELADGRTERRTDKRRHGGGRLGLSCQILLRRLHRRVWRLLCQLESKSRNDQESFI